MSEDKMKNRVEKQLSNMGYEKEAKKLIQKYSKHKIKDFTIK